MGEQLFLCGLSDEQRAYAKPARRLLLHGERPNVRLQVENIRDQLLAVEPPLLADLVEIATYVFAADCSVRRGSAYLRNFGEQWRRSFHLVIAVRKPELWSELTRSAALCDALKFLTEDEWRFDFLPLVNPPSISQYLPGLRDERPELPRETSIVMFSGGLDSFAGAAHELHNTRARVLLVSRRTGVGGMVDARQRELARSLKDRYPGRVHHAPVEAGMTRETEAVEHTQRTRSFLLMAIGMVVATMEKSKRLRFYENGIMSVNLPIASQVVGTRATRSTHPRSLLLLQRLGDLVSDSPIQIENPFAYMTKVEVVRTLDGHPLRALIGKTLSCSGTRRLTTMHPHCGKCIQCLQRRIATLGAGAGDVDAEIDYETDLLLDAREEGDDTVMVVSAVRSAFEHRRLNDHGFAVRYAGELAFLADSATQQGHVETILRVNQMYRRHADIIREIIVTATMEHAEAFTDKTLPASCLLRRVQETADLNPEGAPLGEPAPRTLGAQDEPEKLDRKTAAQLIVAVDADRHRILFDGGLGPITGATEFRIIRLLVELNDANRKIHPSRRPTFSGVELASQAGGGDVALIRKAIERIRRKLNRDARDLHDKELDMHALIETVFRSGYRLNPAVDIVSPGELL